MTTGNNIHPTNVAFNSPEPRPIGCYYPKERDLIALADLLLTAIVRIEIHASDPVSNERLVAYMDKDAGCDDPWREHLISLIRSMKEGAI